MAGQVQVLENESSPTPGSGVSAVVVKVLAGKVDVGMLLKTEDGMQQWRVESFGLIGSAKQFASGVRALTLGRVSGTEPLAGGMILAASWDP
jgi:hypothetical protein